MKLLSQHYQCVNKHPVNGEIAEFDGIDPTESNDGFDNIKETI